MSLETLVDSLLFEGYALYPYTPGATKNATPTPFGIVYPPAYARSLDTTHDHLELRCVAEGDGEFRVGDLTVRTRLSSEPVGDGRRLVSYRVENLTDVAPGLDRGAAIAMSLISTHPVVDIAGGRFLSQLEALSLIHI